MASVDKRPNSTYRARWREHPGGPQQTRTFRRKVDAVNFLDALRGDLVRGRYVDPALGRESFRDYAERWREVQLHRPGTATSAEQQLRLHVYPTIGDLPIASVRSTDVQALVKRLEQRLSPGTVRVVYSRVVAVFRAALRDRVIGFTPCDGIRLPAASASSTLEVLTTDQVVAIADAAPDRYRALVLAGAGTGLRPGELFGLAVDRVDFLRRTVRVDQQIARLEGGGVGLAPLKTDASYRTVPLPTVVGDALAEHLTRFTPHRELGVIFTTGRGGPVQQHPWAEVWATARKRSGVPSWATPHDLRHHYASVLIASGASVKAVQTRLGHRSATTTLDTYGHLFHDEEDRTRQAVDAAFAARAEDQLRTSGTL